jgi:pimeloyl-ACP methyl ester carboxylesterase
MIKMTQRRAGPGLVAVAALATVAAVVVAIGPTAVAVPAGRHAGTAQAGSLGARAAEGELACPELPGLETRCGSMRVPLDRANPAAGQTTVAYSLVRHRGTEPALGTIAFNPGGPGLAPMVGLAQQPDLFVAIFGQLLDTHDMLVVDPRGTGRSAALHCTGLSVENVPATRSALLDAVRSCGRELRERARYHTSAATADDIDAVRRQLRIRRLDLLGESYGTYLLAVYARRHPTRVRSIVLSSAYPLAFDMWARPNARAMGRAIALLCQRSNGSCDAEQVLADLGVLAARLRRHPVGYQAADGTRRVLDDTALAAITYAVAGDRQAMGRLPAVVRAALAGDYGPLVEVAQSQQPPPLSDQPPANAVESVGQAGPADASEAFQSLALTTSVICNDYPTLWDRRASIPERTRDYHLRRRQLDPDVFAPFSPRAWTNGIYDRGNFCLRWPDRDGSSQSTGGRFPDVPVLILSGELDANTPTEEGRAAAQQFRQARMIEVPNTGHVPEHHEAANPCVMALQTEFFRTHRIASTSCLAAIPPITVDA